MDKTDWERLRREQEAGIEPELDSDDGEIDWSTARIIMPPSKTAVTIPLDDEVLDFFKSQGDDYQSRVNAVLRIYLKAYRKVEEPPR